MTEFLFHWKGEKYPLDWGTLTGKESIEIEEFTHLKPAQLLRDFSDGGARGCLAFLWIALKRAGVTVPWEDLLNEPIFKLDGSLGVSGGGASDPSTASTLRSPAGRQAGKGSRARSAKS